MGSELTAPAWIDTPKGHDVGFNLKARGRVVRATALSGAGALLLGLSGCSQDLTDQFARVGLPTSASDRSHYIGDLWVGAWIASGVIGLFVLGLIFYAMFFFRRRPGNEVPRQTKYHLPMELLYTLVPLLIIGVLFFYTVHAQNGVLAKVESPSHTINVVGQKWSWTFNYMESGNPAVGADVHEIGTIEKIPDLYLPVGESVRFNLTSADVIHSFWVPSFYFKLDVIPVHPNSFDMTPTIEGTFDGKCAELCGTYHSAMIFKVHVVSQDAYNTYLKGLAEKGQIGERKAPVGANSALPAPSEEPEK